MKNFFNIKIFLLLLLLTPAAVYSQVNNGVLSSYPVYSNENRTINLSKSLNEISGLATGSGDKIYTHDDESGTIYVFNINKKKPVKKFYLGNGKVKKDFEGIAVVNDSIYLITSSGLLYKFAEAEDKGSAEFIKIKTGLSAEFDVEGLCYDSLSNSLLIACKRYSGKGYKGYRAVYKFNLDKMKLSKQPALLIDLKYLKKYFDIENFSPSGIAVHPLTNNYFIISSHEKAIIELSGEGKILNVRKLKSRFHYQPEGITFLSDYTLVISDEGRNKQAKLTFIPFNP